MDEFYQVFLDELGPQIKKVVPSAKQIEKYKGELPEALLDYWRIYGWGGFHDGLFWITNPDDLSPVVDAWLTHVEISKDTKYHAIARTAFGQLFLWDQRSGQTVTISPHYSQIFTSPPDSDVTSGNSDFTLKCFFSGQVASSLDFDDYKDKPLFKRAVKKLGILESDEMYSFEPALTIGGMPKLENLVIVKMVEQLVLLEQLGDVEVLHMDVSGHI
jgi:hypothetical protein